MLQKLRVSSLGFVLYVLSASTAHAMLMNYTFDVTFDNGPLEGNDYTGSFSLDGLTGSGEEIFRPAGTTAGDESGTVVSFQISIDGYDFTLANSFDLPDAPIIWSIEGNVFWIDYRGSGSDLGGWPQLEISGLVGTRDYTVYHQSEPINGSDVSSYGFLTSISQTQIPEPTTVALLSLGLAGLGLTRRKKKV